MRIPGIALSAAAVALVALLLPGCAGKNDVKLVLTREETIEKPVITDIRFDPAGLVDTRDGGRSINVRMAGDPDLKATFDVQGRLTGQPMNESQPGIYVGSFDVKQGESATLRVTGHLLHPPTGASQELQGGETLTLKPSPPPTPPPPADDGKGTCESFERRLRPVVVYFDFNRHTLRDDGRDLLISMKEELDSHPGCTVYVHGHADEIGTEEYNLNLSRQRAETVADFLQSLGVRSPLERLPHGEAQPAVVDGAPESRAKNRRVELHATVRD